MGEGCDKNVCHNFTLDYENEANIRPVQGCAGDFVWGGGYESGGAEGADVWEKIVMANRVVGFMI